MFRRIDRRTGNAEIARIGDLALECRGGRGLRAAQEYTVLSRARAAGEVARHGAQAVAAGRRRLAHADAAVASGLMKPGTVGTATLFGSISDEAADGELLAVAKKLIESKTAPFDAGAFKDHYTEALKALIDRKTKGKKNGRWRSRTKVRAAAMSSI